MRMPKRGEKGFTLIELLIVVAILGVLAAVIIPNISRFFGAGEEEARNTELANVQLAVDTMMVANKLSSIPNNDFPDSGATSTNSMAIFPDATSDNLSQGGSVGGKTLDPNGTQYDNTTAADDKPGFLLYGHDETSSSDQVQLQNYMRNATTTYYYAIENDGTVHQYSGPNQEAFE